jgi:hypothetical protein
MLWFEVLRFPDWLVKNPCLITGFQGTLACFCIPFFQVYCNWLMYGKIVFVSLKRNSLVIKGVNVVSVQLEFYWQIVVEREKHRNLALGIGVAVKRVEEKNLERFEGKGRQVIDKREL